MSKPDKYKDITDHFETGFEFISDKELVHRHKSTNNEYGRQDISLEMNRRLKQEIEEFNLNSSKQSEVMIKLTKWIAFLTIAMLVLGAFQIVLFFVK